MSTYFVTKVRKETTTGKDAHKHIVGVITIGGHFYSNQEVVKSINDGNEWYTSVPNEPYAKIKEMKFCPHTTCLHSPYLTTAPDHTTKNNLDNLPEG